MILPMHGPRLRAAVGDVVEKVAHAGVLSTFLSSAEVVVHHLLQDAVRDAAASVGYPVDHKRQTRSHLIYS